MAPMRAYVLNLGSIKIDLNAFLVSAVQARLDNPNPQLQFIDAPCYAVLVDHPTAGKFLYDLGASKDALSPSWPNELRQVCPYYQKEGEDMLSQLALCGTKPGEIKTIIQSHLHWDHTGNMALFAHCDVYAPQKELEAALVKIHSTPNLDEQFPYYKPDLMVEVKSLSGISPDEDVELFPGVHLINLPGHTPGMLGMLLELEGGNIVFPSDASYLAANYGPPARCTGGVLYDSRAYMASLEKLRQWSARYDAAVLFSHDMEFFKTKMKAAPDYYA